MSISYVSVANARANWTAENPSWAFDTVHTAAHDAWNAALGKVQIAGGTTSEQELFYTSLYHALLHPNVFSDSNGQYMGFDNQVHSVAGTQKAQYANYSGWDIYHGQAQMSAIVDSSGDERLRSIDAERRRAERRDAPASWALARTARPTSWSATRPTGSFSGYYAFGARAFDTATALQVMLHEATVPNNIRLRLSRIT